MPYNFVYGGRFLRIGDLLYILDLVRVLMLVIKDVDILFFVMSECNLPLLVDEAAQI